MLLLAAVLGPAKREKAKIPASLIPYSEKEVIQALSVIEDLKTAVLSTEQTIHNKVIVQAEKIKKKDSFFLTYFKETNQRLILDVEDEGNDVVRYTDREIVGVLTYQKEFFSSHFLWDRVFEARSKIGAKIPDVGMQYSALELALNISFVAASLGVTNPIADLDFLLTTLRSNRRAESKNTNGKKKTD